MIGKHNIIGNGEECIKESGSDTGMFVRSDNNDNCEILTNWDDGKVQPHYDQIDSTWTFEYNENNACNDNQTATLYAFFKCDEDAGDYRIEHVGTFEDNQCQFEIYVDTIWGCPGMLTEGANEQLSPGTYFIIVLFGGLMIYCMIGWLIGYINNGKYGDFVSNIPHITFWLKLPSLVLAGCVFTKDFFMSLCCGRTTHQPIDYDNLDKD